jgi:hypothetical protein
MLTVLSCRRFGTLTPFLCLILFVQHGFGQVGLSAAKAPPDEKVLIKPAEFYIAGISDDRIAKQAAIYNEPVTQLERFINSNLLSNRALRPVIISIKKLDFIEHEAGNGVIAGQISVLFDFKLKKPFDSVHLVSYHGAIIYSRYVVQQMDKQSATQKIFYNALVWFNTWMNKQAGDNPVLAERVVLSFDDYAEKPEGDTIYYSPLRPLTQNDFQGRSNRSNYNAEVFTSFGYNELVTIEKAVVHVKLMLKTYLPKSAAWAKGGVIDEKSLNHEQRHFDITKIIAEQFKQKLLAMTLPADNYDGDINVAYFDALRQLYTMQTQYDRETSHGTNYIAQTEWNRRIDQELRSN